MNDGIPSLLIQLVLIAAALTMLHVAARRHGRRNAAAPVATEQLFAYRADPAEERDLVGAPEAQAALGRLRGLLPLAQQGLASRLPPAPAGPTFAGRPPERR